MKTIKIDFLIQNMLQKKMQKKKVKYIIKT